MTKRLFSKQPFLKFRADEILRLRAARIGLFYKDGAEMMRNRITLHVQSEEAALNIDGIAGKQKPVERKYETYNDLPEERQTEFDQYTARLKELRAERQKAQAQPVAPSVVFEDVSIYYTVPRPRRSRRK